MSAPVPGLWPLSSEAHASIHPSAHAESPAKRHLDRLVRVASETWGVVSRARGLRLLQARSRRLQVQETVQLGEKRFVAILRVDGEQFLIGGGATGVSLLTQLKPESSSAFQSVLLSQSQQEPGA